MSVAASRAGSSTALQTLAGWLLVAALVIHRVLSHAVGGEMFFDGTIYAAVSRNMAEGIGTAWQPHFSATIFPVFSEHPPLQLWLQAVAFWLFGDHLYVERFYGTAMAVATGVIAVAFWRLLTRPYGLQRFAGLPLILVILLTPAAEVAGNNWMENTLGFATMLSVYLVARAYADGGTGTKRRLAFVAGASFAMVAAVLTKGFVGMFPLAAIGLHWIALRRPGFCTAVADTLVFALVALSVFVLLWLVPDARDYMQRYYEIQVLPSLTGGRGSDGGGLPAVLSLAKLVAGPLAAMLAILALGFVLAWLDRGRARPSEPPTASPFRPATFALLVALSASVPILVSPRLYSFYFMPSMWFYALAAALVAAPTAERLLARIPSSLGWLPAAAAAIGVVWTITLLPSKIGQTRRDTDLLHDLRLIGPYVCAPEQRCRQTVAICGPMYRFWDIHAYAQREFHLSLAEDDPNARYQIRHPSCDGVPPGYVLRDIGLKTLRLVERS